MSEMSHQKTLLALASEKRHVALPDTDRHVHQLIRIGVIN